VPRTSVSDSKQWALLAIAVTATKKPPRSGAVGNGAQHDVLTLADAFHGHRRYRLGPLGRQVLDERDVGAAFAVGWFHVQIERVHRRPLLRLRAMQRHGQGQNTRGDQCSGTSQGQGGGETARTTA
jgi:hypothetical protein